MLWGWSRDELHQKIFSQPISDWEGQPAHTYGEIIHSSLVYLHNSHTQETRETFLVLFPFHLLILSLDHSRESFIYQGALPLGGLTVRAVTVETDTSYSPCMFEISGPRLDSKVFTCDSAAELRKWIEHMEDRRCKPMVQPPSPSHCPLTYLLPCDEDWKKEELRAFLLKAPILQWEGSPIQHMGPPGHLSSVHIINSQRQGLQERLMILFPQDVLLLSVKYQGRNLKYEGRLPRHSIRAVERAALPGRLQFDLLGDLMEPMQVSCTCQEDYQSWIFQLQQPEKNFQVASAPPLMPKKQRSRKQSQERIILNKVF